MRNAETVLGIIQDRGKQGLLLEDVYRQLASSTTVISISLLIAVSFQQNGAVLNQR